MKLEVVQDGSGVQINGTAAKTVQSLDFGTLVIHPAVRKGVPTPIGDLAGPKAVPKGRHRGPDGSVKSAEAWHAERMKKPGRGRRPKYDVQVVGETREQFYTGQITFAVAKARLGASRNTTRELLRGTRYGYA